jgi:hypothetical protein
MDGPRRGACRCAGSIHGEVTEEQGRNRGIHTTALFLEHFKRTKKKKKKKKIYVVSEQCP